MTPESSVASVLARAPDGESPAGEIELTDDFKGRFRLGRILGVGCFGTVYHAEEVATGRPVAVKFLTQQTSRDVLARFLLEGKLLKEIRHPNVLEVMEVQEIGGHPYMICEYVDGGSLAQRLEGKKRLATAEATTIILDVLAGLHACHMRGVVHRDLKPGNILLTGSGQAKVADLGIAKDYSSGSPNLTIPGMILGTPKYMAPEQIRGAPVVIASDL
ncbi:MAG: serine/threonine protein kinase [Candidatus Riflebacteria bacterium]|nr:serine/threonine protein kinase [Candidatus Riflebacteria bacterium]